MTSKIFIIACLSFFVCAGRAQTSSADSLNNRKAPLFQQSNYGTVTIHSSGGVHVYCDTSLLGVTPFDSLAVEEGRHIFTFVHPESGNWQYSPIIETVYVHRADNLYRTVTFPVVYHITSTPFNAAVHYQDSIIGQTPLFLSNAIAGGQIILSKDGYENSAILLSADISNIHVDLRPLDHAMQGTRTLYLAETQSRSNLPIYITTGTSILTGVVAAYAKIKADSYYNDYQINHSPNTLNDVRRFDTISGITLAASEISLVMLSYFLISR